MRVAHCDSQQREHVGIAETFSCHHLLTESLRNNNKYLDVGRWGAFGMSHPCELVKVAR